MKNWLFLFLFTPLFTEAQSKKQKRALEVQRKADEVIINNLKAHIQFLADDRLEGRRAGSKGEELAMRYISAQFKQIGLQPKGSQEYAQPFDVDEGKKIESSTYLKLNGNLLELQKEFIPLAFSANKKVKGSAAMALRESGEPWFVDVKEWLETNRDNPHYNINEALQQEAVKLGDKGASAVFVFNSGNLVDNISFIKNDQAPSVKIPVVFLNKEGEKKYLQDKFATLDIETNVTIKENKRRANNVVGYLDNGATNTIIVGAHYDHLGYGEDANALDTGKVIHNGADDNASGTAALIELAKMLVASKSKSNNYLFICFSAEELGLRGSKYWIENATINTPTNYMVNMDMVGRYSADRKLTIGGFGTSPVWSTVLTAAADKNIEVKFDTTGGGPSDHASFYRKDIPVLFFFTGSHSDYHKATDDHDKINYDGELQIIKYAQRIIESTDAKGKLAFTKTKEPQMGSSSQFSVSLGVIPDYAYSGSGLRIDGVSPKRLAEKIGLQAGDILMQLGDYKISEINSYMQALGKFKKGDKTVLRFKRGTSEKDATVEF